MPTTIYPATATTRIFQNGNSQVLCIPQDLRTDKKEFFIRRIGDVYIAYPTDDPWAPARKAIESFSDDFMCERNQPSWGEVAEHPSLNNMMTSDTTIATGSEEN